MKLDAHQPDAGYCVPFMALTAQHAFDSATRRTWGDSPELALAALGDDGPLSPSEWPMGVDRMAADHTTS